MNLHALVIEPDAGERCVVRRALHKQQWKVCEAVSVEEAMGVMDKYSWNLVFCDADFANQCAVSTSSATLLSELKRRFGPQLQIVMASKQGGEFNPLEAFLNGASDYIRKPCQEEKIAECSRQVAERHRASESEATETRLSSGLVAQEISHALPELVGESEAMIKVFRRLGKIVENVYLDGLVEKNRASLPSVFITGETGTGKELVAQMIHRRSRPGGQFVPVNCSNLTPELAESELFGHEPGSFTGASRERQGLWEEASGGTLFLDEITEAPPTVLPKLLRVLQDGMYRRLGSNRWKRAGVQVIAASNRDMQKEIQEGRFRRDLYHRLSLHRLHLPPLRDRIEDLPLIVRHLGRRHFARNIRIAQDALDLLMSYPFPGNVRELENIVRGAAGKSRDGVVYAVDVTAYVEMLETNSRNHQRELKTLIASAAASRIADVQPLTEEGLDEQVQRFKLRVARETLAKCGGNVTRAAQALKISRPCLYRMLKELEAESRAWHGPHSEFNENGFSYQAEANCVS